MTTFKTQDTDVFADAHPGIEFDSAGETWTITTGVLVSSSNNDGVLSAFNASALFNNGTILSAHLDGLGVRLLGNDSFVSNAADAKIVGADGGIFVEGKTVDIENQGSILGLASIGVNFGFDSDHVTLNNSGSIDGRTDGVLAFSHVDSAVIHNSGLITSSHDAIEVFTGEGLTTFIDNAAGGTISGGSKAIVVHQGGIALDNDGQVIGGIDIAFDSPDADTIVNHGKITGEVFLGAGNDVFIGTGGTSGGVFGNDGNDRLIGGNAADKLYGGTGDDRLIGAGGNDTLDGGPGLDTLTGGPGKDQFVFQSNLSPGLNLDRITDFTVHVDKIVLDETVFQGIGHAGPLAAGFFHVGAAARGANDHIIYNPNNGFLIYDANGNHAGGAVHFATLAPHLALTHGDFLVTEILVA